MSAVLELPSPQPAARAARSKEILLTPLQRAVVNGYQRGFPITERPYRDIATELGVTEADVLACLSELQARGVVGRIGAVVRSGRVGASTLAAMQVPTDSLDRVAELVSSYAEVNHNYAREHEINLWFVAVAPDETRLEYVLAEIEVRTGLQVLRLPMQTAYHIDLGFYV